jgi:lysophospholipase L1-like esterase
MEETLKKLIYPAIIFSALTLAACGGGGGGGGGTAPASNEQPQNPNNAAPSLASSPQTINYYGDSTVFGWRTSATDQVDTTAPEAFASALPNSSIHVVNNLGLSGQTACELLAGTNLENDWATEMDTSPATVVILNHGINDAVSQNRVSLDQYRTCLTSLATIARTEGKRVIFETPNPIADQDSLAPFVQAMRDVAATQNLPVIDQYATLNQKYGGDAGLITRDGLHPRDEIYIEKGQFAAAEFAKLK